MIRRIQDPATKAGVATLEAHRCQRPGVAVGDLRSKMSARNCLEAWQKSVPWDYWVVNEDALT